MDWKKLLAFIWGSVDEELLQRLLHGHEVVSCTEPSCR